MSNYIRAGISVRRVNFFQCSISVIILIRLTSGNLFSICFTSKKMSMSFITIHFFYFWGITLFFIDLIFTRRVGIESIRKIRKQKQKPFLRVWSQVQVSVLQEEKRNLIRQLDGLTKTNETLSRFRSLSFSGNSPSPELEKNTIPEAKKATKDAATSCSVLTRDIGVSHRQVICIFMTFNFYSSTMERFFTLHRTHIRLQYDVLDEKYESRLWRVSIRWIHRFVKLLLCLLSFFVSYQICNMNLRIHLLTSFSVWLTSFC